MTTPSPERVDSIHECVYCQTQTNLLEPIGMYGNLRYRCPATAESPLPWYIEIFPESVEERHAKHAELQQLIERRDEIDKRLRPYSRTDDSDETVRHLEKERDVVETRIAALRDWFDGKFDDLEDIDENDADVLELDGSHARVAEECRSVDGENGVTSDD